MLEHLKCKTKDQLTTAERNVLAWAALMDADFLVVMEEVDFDCVFREAEALGLRRDFKKPVLRLEEATVLRLLYTDLKFGIESASTSFAREASSFAAWSVGR